MSQISVSGLYLYPIKSLRGIEVDRLAIRDGRPIGDRLWVIVDEQGRFMHQRDFPVMATIDVEVLADGSVELSASGLPRLQLEDRPSASPSVELVWLWRRAAPVHHVSRAADAWMSSALGSRCRVMRFATTAAARNVPNHEVDSSLQDATPFHLTTDDSLDDLCRRMGLRIPMIRFRPNIVARGAAAYAEDGWQALEIGGHAFQFIRPCTRCTMTATDHHTGVRAREPLRTLATYRRRGFHVVFGHYITTSSRSGELSLGNDIHVLRSTSGRP